MQPSPGDRTRGVDETADSTAGSREISPGPIRLLSVMMRDTNRVLLAPSLRSRSRKGRNAHNDMSFGRLPHNIARGGLPVRDVRSLARIGMAGVRFTGLGAQLRGRSDPLRRCDPEWSPPPRRRLVRETAPPTQPTAEG